MYQDFRVPFYPLVKLLVRCRRVVHPTLMTDNEAWICFARDDHVAEVAIVLLDIALPSTKREILLCKEF